MFQIIILKWYQIVPEKISNMISVHGMPTTRQPADRKETVEGKL
jgi:hypothetical protein